MDQEFSIKSNYCELAFFPEAKEYPQREIQDIKFFLQLGLWAIDEFFDSGEVSSIAKKHNFSYLQLSLTLCDEKRIQKLNKEYRDKDKATDVLSFPMQENYRLNEVDSFSPIVEMGDIFICDEVCQTQADQFCITFNEEMVHLFLHGMLHLFGYDHELNDEEDELMRELESELVHRVSEIKEDPSTYKPRCGI